MLLVLNRRCFFIHNVMCRYSVHRDIRALSVDMFKQFFAMQVSTQSV